jgi:hypothetical protein
MKASASRETNRLKKVLKPLGRTEARQAIETAVEHLGPRLIRDGRSRYRTLGAQLGITRGTDKGTPARRIEVFVVDYLNRRHFRVIVTGNRIAEVGELDWQPAFSAEEIQEAEAIVARDERLRTVVRRGGLFSSTFAPGGNAAGVRKIGLRYLVRRKGIAAVVATAEVDLVEQRVMNAWTSGSRGAPNG